MSEEKKTKISFKEAVKQQLEAKKNKQNIAQIAGIENKKTKKMTSQQARKVNNSHRKMGI